MFAKRLKRYRKCIILTLALIGLQFLIIQNTDLLINLNLLPMEPRESLSCNYSESEDVLPLADTGKFPSKSIFFHETSCKGGLDARQACAVESAARAHPDWEINVLFTSPATKETLKNNNALLDTFQNLNFYRIHVLEYAKGTPLEQFIAKGALNRSLWPITHASDVIRYLTLYKWGGVYLDLDVVVAKPLGSLGRNWAARESETSVNGAVMAFSTDSVGRRITEAFLRDIDRNFRGDMWSYNGPGLITRVFKSICATAEVIKMTASICDELAHTIVWFIRFYFVRKVFVLNERGRLHTIMRELNFDIAFEIRASASWAAGCNTSHLPYFAVPAFGDWFEVYGPEYFYPVKWGQHQIYFETGYINMEKAYGYHVWNQFSRRLKIQRGSPYETLAKKFCPTVYYNIMDNLI